MGCGNEDWPVVLGGPLNDQVLALGANDQVVVAAGVGDLGDAPGGVVTIDGVSVDAAHLWSLSGGHQAIRGIDPFGLASSVDAVPGTSDFIVGGAFAGGFDLGGLRVESVDEPEFERLGGDVWLARVGSTDGTVQWLRRLGGPGLDTGITIATSETQMVVTGRFHEQIDLGGGPLVSADGPGAMPGFAGDVFVGSFDLDGNYAWSRSGGGPASDSPADVRVDTNGEVTVVGSFALQANFGGADLTTQGSGDAFIVHYGKDGGHLWSASFGGVNNDAATALALDPSGRIVVGGFVEGMVDFGGGPRDAFGQTDGFVALYNPDGTHVWSVTLGGAGRDLITRLAVVGDFVVATGKFEQTMSLDPPLISQGGTDGFVVWIDIASGSIVKAVALGGPSTDGASSVTASPTATYVGGFFSDAAQLNGSATSHGGRDGFITRF